MASASPEGGLSDRQMDLFPLFVGSFSIYAEQKYELRSSTCTVPTVFRARTCLCAWSLLAHSPPAKMNQNDRLLEDWENSFLTGAPLLSMPMSSL